MATQVNKSNRCFSLNIGPDLTVDGLVEELGKLQRMGRGSYRMQIDNDQMGDPKDVHNMQVFDEDKIVELTHE